MGRHISKHTRRSGIDRRRTQPLRVAIISGVIIVFFVTGIMSSDALNLVAQTLGFRLPTPVKIELPPIEEPSAPDLSVPGIVPAELEIHPDHLFREYLGAPEDSADETLVRPEVVAAFNSLAEMYRHRQAVDDNFTVRAYRIDTGEVLGIYSLDDERSAYEESGEADWHQIDRKRTRLTKEVVEKLAAAGVPRRQITVRWGRRDQILEARERETRYIEYEVQLARYYGLSLLVTEIGTVETFNNDRLVSRVGARGRYQMMPAMLRARSINHYRLRTRAGTEIRVQEEWNPLLTMEATFIVARAYSNAVGHEIPGISAYHTGPYNIFKVYREFLTVEGDQHPEATTNVVGAYLWGLTHGYDTVRSQTTFRNYSRGYIPAIFGALRATESIPIDTTQTLLAELVRLKSGESMFLSQLLEHLDGADERLLWRVAEDQPLYERFREMNQHFDLPPALGNGSVPDDGDLFLVAATPKQDYPVQFFLPLGASAELRSREVDEIDYDRIVRFDHSTFEVRSEALTVWDQLYADLVEDVRNFGFTLENRARLAPIAEHIDELSRTDPSPFRTSLKEIVRLHERVWASNYFDMLAKVVPAASGRQRLSAQPPDQIVTDDSGAGSTPQAE